MTEEKEKIINAFNNAWNKKIASENSYGKLASKEMFENKEEIKTEISTDCSYYKDVVKEEILIDGVNVAGCVRLQDDKISCDLGGECKGWENCNYKQLKRLEQENKALKDNNNHLQAIIDDGRAENKRFREENKELKEKNVNLKAHKNFMFKENDKLMRKNSIIRIALNEIKDITTNALAKQRPYKEDFIEIQNIINEVLNDN